MTSVSETEEIISEHMRDLVAFVAASPERQLPAAVALKGKLHLLDTLAAMISGTRLGPGEIALRYVAGQNGLGTASVVGTALRVPCVSAAFANGMTAHSDETDDSHAASLTHPGCAVVPAALAYAEVKNRSGLNLLNAVVTGYEVAARINTALGPRALSDRGHGPHSIGGHWGAGAAAGALCGFSEQQLRVMFSYVGQQTAGVACWMRDHSHVLKAFVFAGMPSRNGAFAAELVDFGFSGMEDVLSGTRNFFYAFSDNPQPELVSRNLGRDYAISTAAIKRWCVGSPIQAALSSLQALMVEHEVGPSDIKAIRAHIPDHAVHVIDNNAMPDLNLQQCFALMLLEGTLTFAAAHDLSRMADPDAVRLRTLVEIIPSRELTEAIPVRQAIVEIDTVDGRKLYHRTYSVRGTPGDPMPAEEVIAKARDLILPILGSERTEGLINAVMTIEQLADANALSSYWS